MRHQNYLRQAYTRLTKHTNGPGFFPYNRIYTGDVYNHTQLVDKKYYFGNTTNMKTAISVPDNLFQQIEEASKKMEISRSRLFSMAIQEFLQHYYAENVTIKLNV